MYLYFSKCKIIKADLIPGKNIITFAIKSSKTTPKHYPEHFMLKGKIDVFFKINFNGIISRIVIDENIRTIFGNEASLVKPTSLIGKEISVLCYFDPMADIILDCIGIGRYDEMPIVFNNERSEEENAACARVAILNSKLVGKKSQEKKTKI